MFTAFYYFFIRIYFYAFYLSFETVLQGIWIWMHCYLTWVVHAGVQYQHNRLKYMLLNSRWSWRIRAACRSCPLGRGWQGVFFLLCSGKMCKMLWFQCNWLQWVQTESSAFQGWNALLLQMCVELELLYKATENLCRLIIAGTDRILAKPICTEAIGGKAAALPKVNRISYCYSV